MGFFKRRKKNKAEAPAADIPVEASEIPETAVSAEESAAPAGDELTAVLSAAAAAYEADSFAAFAGSPAQMELAAVLSAAVMAYESGGTAFPIIGAGPSGLYIRKLNRNAGFAPAWGQMGNREAIDARRF